MTSIMMIFQDGGPLMYPLLLLVILGATLAPIFALVGAFTRSRIPGALWLVAPVLVVLLAELIALTGLIETSEALFFSTPEMKSTLAHMGTRISMGSLAVGTLLAGGLLLLGAWGAGFIAAINPGRDARFSIVGAIVPAGLAVIGGGALIAIDAMSVGFALVALAPALGLAGLRTGGAEEDRARLAETRASAAVCGVLAMLSFGAAVSIFGYTEAHRAMATASPEMIDRIVSIGTAAGRSGLMSGLIAAAVAAVAGLSASFRSLGEMFNVRSLISIALGGLGLLAILIGAVGVSAYYDTAMRHWQGPQLAAFITENPNLPMNKTLGGDFGSLPRVHFITRTEVWNGDRWESRILGEDAQFEGVAVAAPADTPAMKLFELNDAPAFVSLLATDESAGFAAQDEWLAGLHLYAGGISLMRPGNTPPEPEADEPYDATIHVLVQERGGVLLLDPDHLPVDRPSLSEAMDMALSWSASNPELYDLRLYPSPQTTFQDLVGVINTMEDADSSLILILAEERPSLSVPDEAEQTITASSTAGEMTLIGSLPRTEIEKAIQRKMASFNNCYERGLVKNPALAGYMKVKFIIAADGGVSSVSVESSTLSDGEVVSCIKRSIKRLRFPSPEGGGIVVVRYPFTFRPVP
ncbi:MAG: AgmX/PglI C-terminal domain-containing protein [Myxococcota bacterium]